VVRRTDLGRAISDEDLHPTIAAMRSRMNATPRLRE
jgi:hypothetical protein